MKIIENNDKNEIEIYTPYNPEFVSEIKKRIGDAKWSASKKCWLAPIESINSVRALMKDIYGEDDRSLITYIDLKIEFKDSVFTECAPVLLFGRILATASSRDSGARLGKGVELLKGEVTSGGSWKNWRTEVKEGSIFIMRKVPKNLVESWNNEDIFITIIDNSNLNRTDLLAEKERLLTRINEINKILGEKGIK